MAAMATVKSSTLTYLIHHLLRHPKPTSPVCLFLRPFSVSVLASRISNHHDKRRFPWISSSSLPLPRPYISISPFLVPKSFSSVSESEQDEDNVSLASLDDEQEDGSGLTMRENVRSSTLLELSAKEKRKLASYAHSLGDKLKSQLVGKSGVTDSVVLSFIETLEKNELLKVKIHRTCPGELEDMILHLEEATGSVSVGQIARTVILYRRSPTKLKTDEKKKTNEE
ncbi:YhbY-like superfamily [Arabidopsis suecica]|uniref:YhbY-like superfamily n=1 Tax=Arabidopsis suecica TaxID=45249 RepID=A0A8T2ADU8_ARASU|nr:YhbY-like superfamily [Arabidopsis suecica]